MPSDEKHWIKGRKAIMEFLGISNWDFVVLLHQKFGLPVFNAPKCSQWRCYRVALQRWLVKIKFQQINIFDGSPSCIIRKHLFLIMYLWNSATVLPACRDSKIRKQTYYNWLEDQKFVAACDEVKNIVSIDWVPAFLQAYKVDGNSSRACKAAGISLNTYYRLRRMSIYFDGAVK